MKNITSTVEKHRKLIFDTERYIWQNPETCYNNIADNYKKLLKKVTDYAKIYKNRRRRVVMLETREIIAANIAALRKNANLTQAELAEKINYSDKAISKWERGDSIPDVLVLKELADLFSVTVDYFLSVHSEDEVTPRLESHKKRTRLAVWLTACIAPYFAALILWLVFYYAYKSPDWLWKLFIIPLPAIMIISLVFTLLWNKDKKQILFCSSGILWTSLLVAFTMSDAWFLFIIGVPLQLVIIFWLLIAKPKGIKK